MGRRLRARTLFAAAAALVAGIAASQSRIPEAALAAQAQDTPEAEFHMARMIYATRGGGGGSRGWRMPWWAIDYPEAEVNFLPALARFTRLSVAKDSRHLELTDERLFDYPWLFVQQVGQGYWMPTDTEAERLREYLLRGGFLVVDDFHSDWEWPIFEAAIRRVLPDRAIVDIPEGDPLLEIVFPLDNRTQIPGQRHLRGPGMPPRMEGPPRWRGIYDDDGRLMVAINFNIDMGDAWEHANDPYYPLEMTALAYRYGVNYVIYAMTH